MTGRILQARLRRLQRLPRLLHLLVERPVRFGTTRFRSTRTAWGTRALKMQPNRGLRQTAQGLVTMARHHQRPRHHRSLCLHLQSIKLLQLRHQGLGLRRIGPGHGTMARLRARPRRSQLHGQELHRPLCLLRYCLLPGHERDPPRRLRQEPRLLRVRFPRPRRSRRPRRRHSRRTREEHDPRRIQHLMNPSCPLPSRMVLRTQRSRTRRST